MEMICLRVMKKKRIQKKKRNKDGEGEKKSIEKEEREDGENIK